MSSSSTGNSAPTTAGLQTLQARDHKIDYTMNLGKQSVVTAQSNLAQRGGFYCSSCDVLLKDSRSYNIHINGRKHQKKSNHSMNIRRVQPDEVLLKLQTLAKKYPHPYTLQSDTIEGLNIQTQLEIDQAFGTFDHLTTKEQQQQGEQNNVDDDNQNDEDSEGWEDAGVVITANTINYVDDTIQHVNKRHKQNNTEMQDNDHDDEATKTQINALKTIALLQKQQQEERSFEIVMDDADWDDDEDWDEEEGVEIISKGLSNNNNNNNNNEINQTSDVHDMNMGD